MRTRSHRLTFSLPLITSFVLTACGGNDGAALMPEASTDTEIEVTTQTANSPADSVLRALIAEHEITGDASTDRDLPQITDLLPQLGKQLFFSKSLGGGFDSSCVSCHHPALGGADALSLSIGVDAINPDLLGEGRLHTDGLPLVPRNAPTVFNVGLWDTGLFWDSRVESIGKEDGVNGAASGIRTPDTAIGVADPNAGQNLTTAQARFPVTSSEEMKTETFENGRENETIRNHLAARIGDYGIGSGELTTNEWLQSFRLAFNSVDEAEDLVTFNNIALAIGEYERSMVFTNSPWKAYVEGDNDALTEEQKNGAILFFTPQQQGGANCVACHSGDLFSDGTHANVAFPQIGPGKGDDNGDNAEDDFGRERETANPVDRYRFRVPSLLNIELTAPYGHTGAYATLEEVMRHYSNPQGTVDNLFNDGGWCELSQFENITNCSTLYPNAEFNSNLALDKLRSERANNISRFANINLNNTEISQLVAFMRALTDTCITDRECIDPWIANNADNGPDEQQLNAIDQIGNLL